MIIVQSQIFLENLTAITLCNLQQSQLQWRQNYTDSDGIGGGVGGHAKYLVLLQMIDTAAKSCYEARK